MLLDMLPDHFSSIAKMKDAVSENLYQVAMYGVTQQTMIDFKAIATMVVVGGLSAFGGSFLTARDNAVELKQYSKAQEEFRIEMRQFMREQSIEVRSLSDRLTRQEVISATVHPRDGISGMGGMGTNGGRK